MEGREGGRRDVGEGGREREGREEGREGGMTVIPIGMFNSNPMTPQYLNDTLT